MGYIGKHGIGTLQNYKYNSVDKSLVAKYIFQPFWTRCVTIFPLWLSPNLITLTGSLFLVTSALIGYIYSPQLDSPPPRWVHLAHGLLLFLYQTFDALDGKQAIRTNTDGPIDELFDHGCDALACAFESLAFGSTTMCGKTTFWFWVTSASHFYCTTLEYFFTSTLNLPIINGPTEGLMLIYLCHFFTFFFGAEWWAQDFRKCIPILSCIPLLPTSEIPFYRLALFLMIALGVIPTMRMNLKNVSKIVHASKGSLLSPLSMLFPFCLLVIGVLVWSFLSPCDIMRKYPHLMIVGTGFAFGFLVGRMILAHICDEPKGLKIKMCLSLCILPLAIANALTARLNGGSPLVDEYLILLGYCAFTVTLYVHFGMSVLHEISSASGMYIFRVMKKEI